MVSYLYNAPFFYNTHLPNFLLISGLLKHLLTRRKIIAKREDETFSIISPNDVSVEDARKILEFLNTVRSPKDLAEAVEFQGERDVGIKVAERIMTKRAELGGQFKSLQDVANVDMVGSKRFTDIVISTAGKNIQVEPERLQFRALILKNPNYFGNIAKAPFEPVKIIASNTSYEELMCVGYNPQFKRLEAVIHIKQHSGYGTGICSVGTPEYVRFYIDWNNTGSWTDLGIVGFDAYNITGAKPLEYDVTLNIDPKERFCTIENLPKVRAVLSWNYPPPASSPDFMPVWGNVKESRIQVGPMKFFLPKDMLDIMKLGSNKKISEIEPIFEIQEPIPLPKPKTLNIADLAELYKGKGVPAHRFAFAEVTKLISNPSFAEQIAVSSLKGILPAGVDINIDDLIDVILETEGDTRYEELTCVALNRDQDALIGIIKVKLSSGYSGSLCSGGSTEYVAFWLDWGDGSGWTYAGTTSVNVHDITGMPSEGLHYATFLPLNSFARRRPCGTGALTPKVRAILSWQTPPPSADPNYIPTWGNREETVVQIMPGPKIIGHLPFIETVGNMSVASIDSVSGLANGAAVGAGFTATESPFGGVVVVTGHIANPPDVLGGGGGVTPFKYRVSVSDDGGLTWQQVNNKFRIWLTELNGGIWSGPTPFDQTADAEGWYEYKEDIQGSSQRFVSQNVLAQWLTGGAMGGLWRIKIEAKDPATNIVYPGTQVITIKLDNLAPGASIEITSGGGGCADFLIGDTISGNYSVNDMHFGSLNISIEPNLGGVNFTSPLVLPREYPIVPTTGEAGSWSLDTLLMPRCGYVVRLTARDRTIVNSGSVGFYASAVVGLCLREKS